MSVSVRRAEVSDFDTVVELIRALAEFENLTPPDSDAVARLRADGWGEIPRFEVWLAELDGMAAAYALLFHTYSSFLARPTLYLEDIFVLPDYRGRGIGSKLFHHARQLAANRGCGRMEWCCLDWNRQAQRFYESVGARRLDEWYYYRLTADAFRPGSEEDVDAG